MGIEFVKSRNISDDDPETLEFHHRIILYSRSNYTIVVFGFLFFSVVVYFLAGIGGNHKIRQFLEWTRIDVVSIPIRSDEIAKES